MTIAERAIAAWTIGIACASLGAQGPPGDDLLRELDATRAHYAEVARDIWTYAEVGYQEQRSSARLQQELTSAGFVVTAGVAGMPTAFVATYGAGKPVVALLAEFDALPGLSQDAVAERRPIVDGGAGHGCGHNLLGTGSVAAAVAVRHWLASSGRPGTVKVFGTPAQEGGSGKVYMIRAGLFAGVDVVLTWHPGDRNDASPASSLANITGKFRFHGVASHAASAPEKGRSALDAVEAMDFMVNLMREHVPQETRLEYVIRRGGAAPNVVPDFAESYFDVRQPNMRILDGIWDRVQDAAKGAALGTGATSEVEIIGASYNLLPNPYLSTLAHKNLTRVGGVVYTPAESAFAEVVRRALPAAPAAALGSPERIADLRPIGGFGSSSSDLGDVSWNVPTLQVFVATFPPGVPNHSWQAAACAGGSIGMNGMLVAAKTLALTAAEIYTDPSHVASARADFEARQGAGFVYNTRLAGRQPPLDYQK